MNGVAYIEGDLKLSHLRILITIIAHLQRAIQHRISYKGKTPETILPAAGPMTVAGKSRTLTIPLSAFSLGYNNSSKLRSLLTELEDVRIIFPPSKTQSALQHSFRGLIADYTFPAYARTVELYLPEDLTWRLLLTEDGYTTFSQKEVITLTNKYTVRLYWLICAWRNRGGFVMRLSELRRILCLSRAYSRLDNLIARVLAPAESELEERFPIWFHYRFYQQEDSRMIVFKIHLRVSAEQRSKDMAAAWDYCFNLMASIGARQDTLRDIFARLDYEDIRPFMEKLGEIVTYARTHSATIQSPDRYILSVMDTWFASWFERYK
ncbi:MAG: replication initiation protein [Bacteroidales bacterium]|nr:replication initiation protein [Bacteroidales bacterium]